MTIEVMMVALKRSGDALSALFFFLVTSLVLFSTLLYFAERGIWDPTLETFVDASGNPRCVITHVLMTWLLNRCKKCQHEYLVLSTVSQRPFGLCW